MNDDIARLLYEGAVAVSTGRKAEAQEKLLKVIELDEQNEQAWLWLSGAVEDPSDQEIALENVLALNPNNTAAQEGLNWLRSVGQTAPASGEWTPPPPRNEDEVDEIACWNCKSSLYSVAQFCWQCHSPVHCCNNCSFRPDPRCKQLQGIAIGIAMSAQNKCPWWHPAE